MSVFKQALFNSIKNNPIYFLISAALLSMGLLILLLGHYNRIGLPYAWTNSTLTPSLNVAGIIMIGIGLISVWYKANWQREIYTKHEWKKIIVISSVALFAVGITTGLIGFTTLSSRFDHALTDNLTLKLSNQTNLFAHEIEESITQVNSLGAHPQIIKPVRKAKFNFTHDPHDNLYKALQDLPSSGFNGISIFTTDGKMLAQRGQLIQFPQLKVNLKSTKPTSNSSLLWDNQFILHSEVEIVDDSGRIGLLIGQQILPKLTQLLFQQDSLHQTMETEICATQAKQVQCFPTRLSPSVFSLPLHQGEQPLVIYHALTGKTGHMQAQDYRKQNVIAAYGPIGDLGLGMVLKMDTSELYAPIREQFQYLLPLLLLLVAVGALLLHTQIKPLMVKLIHSEQEARRTSRELKEKEGKIRAIVEHVAEGIITIDQTGAIESFNPAASKIFGYPTNEVIGRNIAILLPKDKSSYAISKARYLLTGEPHLIGGDNIEITGYHKDGSTFQAEFSVSEMPHHGRKMFVLIVRDVTERKLSEQRLVYLAQYDSLTGLPNRNLFHERLSQAIARSYRANRLMALMYLDIDYFKSINDSMGHLVGDTVLKNFADRLTNCVRTTDTVARLGGDEFTIIMEGLTQPEDASSVAQKIVNAMQREFIIEDRAIFITTSIGIAFLHDQALTADELLKQADSALYRAKELGRNTYEVATPEWLGNPGFKAPFAYNKLQ